MKRPLFFVILLFLFFSLSCRNGTKEKESFIPVFSTYKSDSVNKNNIPPKDEIFYGILTPVEICTIFNRLEIPHNNEILNPVSNKDQYLSS